MHRARWQACTRRAVVNADLKPDNVLLRAPPEAQDEPDQATSAPRVVICDFGSAFSESETDTAKLAFEMQTLPYRAPEVWIGQILLV